MFVAYLAHFLNVISLKLGIYLPTLNFNELIWGLFD